MSLKNQVEAALFAAGRPVEVPELAKATGAPYPEVRKALKTLAAEYADRDGALEVLHTGRSWSMQLREAYADGESLADAEIPRDVLKTAALIAYHQPILQADLRKMVGEKVYEHVRSLRASRLIHAYPKGRSLQLSTTQRFPEYFGLEVTNREDLRQWMADQGTPR